MTPNNQRTKGTERICYKCRKGKNLALEYYGDEYGTCKECIREYQKLRRARLKAEGFKYRYVQEVAKA